MAASGHQNPRESIKLHIYCLFAHGESRRGASAYRSIPCCQNPRLPCRLPRCRDRTGQGRLKQVMKFLSVPALEIGAYQADWLCRWFMRLDVYGDSMTKALSLSLSARCRRQSLQRVATQSERVAIVRCTRMGAYRSFGSRAVQRGWMAFPFLSLRFLAASETRALVRASCWTGDGRWQARHGCFVIQGG